VKHEHARAECGETLLDRLPGEGAAAASLAYPTLIGGAMSSATHEVVSRLHMLGLKCDDLPPDRVSSPIAALACFPMYMVANVHGWTSDRQFKIPLIDIQGLEAFREAFVIGEKEGRLEMTAEHRKVVDSMMTTVRPPDRVIYEYALETLKLCLAVAGAGVAERVRVLVARMVVDVARASGKGLFGTAEKVSPQERECVAHIAAELRLREAPKAAETLNNL
jgi:hypothetical protein